MSGHQVFQSNIVKASVTLHRPSTNDVTREQKSLSATSPPAVPTAHALRTPRCMPRDPLSSIRGALWEMTSALWPLITPATKLPVYTKREDLPQRVQQACVNALMWLWRLEKPVEARH